MIPSRMAMMVIRSQSHLVYATFGTSASCWSTKIFPLSLALRLASS
jgi:hypothetical protein